MRSLLSKFCSLPLQTFDSCTLRHSYLTYAVGKTVIVKRFSVCETWLSYDLMVVQIRTNLH